MGGCRHAARIMPRHEVQQLGQDYPEHRDTGLLAILALLVHMHCGGLHIVEASMVGGVLKQAQTLSVLSALTRT